MKYFFSHLNFSLPWFLIGLLLGVSVAIILLVTIGKKAANKAAKRIDSIVKVNHEISKILNK